MQGFEVLNPDQLICTLDKKTSSMPSSKSRRPWFRHRRRKQARGQPIGLIPIDSIFSPVTRVKYAVESTRVGQRTDYDKLIVEVWTDGRITPEDAMLQASAILRHHLDVFVNFNEDVVEFDETPAGESEENMKLRKLLNMSVNEIELSVRAANCLNNANITTVGQLAQKIRGRDAEVPQLRQEIAQRNQGQAAAVAVRFGMKFDAGWSTCQPVATAGASMNGAADVDDV